MSQPSLVADVALRGGSHEHGDAVRDMFGRIAPTYDAVNRILSGGLDASWRRRAVDRLRGAPAGPTLDLCAGTMDMTALLAVARPRQRLIACDFSAEMLRAGHAKAPTAETVVADAQTLPFEDASIAVVVAAFGVRNVTDPERAIAEVRRVLVPGGVFVTLEFFRPTELKTRLFHRLYATCVLPAAGGLVSGDRGAYAYLARSMNGFLSRVEYERALLQRGFLLPTSDELTLGVASIVRAEVPS